MSDLRCNLCSGPLTVRWPHVIDPETRETFAIFECPTCKLGHTTPNPEDLSHYYGKTYHGGRHGLTALYCAKRRLRFVQRALGNTHGHRILDVGCGDGTFLIAARQSGWEPVGTELNPDIARSAELQVAETTNQIAHLGPFDCITLWHSLEHIRDPHKEITTLAKLLTPKGVLLIAVPNFDGLQARVFGPQWFHLDVPRHLYHFTERSLMELLDLAGLTLIQRWDQEFEYDLLGWSQSLLNLVMPTPNVFYRALVGKPAEAKEGMVALNYVLGLFFSALTLPAVPLGTFWRQGGTLVVAGRRGDS